MVWLYIKPFPKQNVHYHISASRKKSLSPNVQLYPNINKHIIITNLKELYKARSNARQFQGPSLRLMFCSYWTFFFGFIFTVPLFVRINTLKG